SFFHTFILYQIPEKVRAKARLIILLNINHRNESKKFTYRFPLEQIHFQKNQKQSQPAVC
ncbi:MAG: hypothetical protein PUI77_01310, partial [Mollicutes bacterium]|nr:hypothetical protein [Mollicutes bacterium]